MRVIKSLEDVGIVLRELTSWKDRLATKSWDMNGLRITNASKSKDPNDYVIQSELNDTIPKVVHNDQFFTIIFSSTSTVTIGQLSAPWITGHGRESQPVEIWLAATVPPAGGVLAMNLSLNGVNLLINNISLGATQTGPIFSSGFINPTPKIGRASIILPVVVTASNAALVSIGLVCKRILPL